MSEVAAGDDLMIIGGVGPAMPDALRETAVTSFARLGEMTLEAIEKLLADANVPLVVGHNAATWPRQARRRTWPGVPQHRVLDLASTWS